MKLLLLLSMLIPFLGLAEDATPPEVGRALSDDELSRKFVSIITERKVEGFIGASADFNDCRAKNKFKDTSDATKLEAAKKCFTDRIKNKSEEDLARLSDQLGLQNYGLVKSKNSRDITEFLTKKMHKALTGVDLDEKDPSVLKNRKMVDQKIFIELYANRLQKNVLFEISRFCFENLRKEDPDAPQSTFLDHWGSELGLTGPPKEMVFSVPVTDTGTGSFGSDLGGDDGKDIYEKILDSIGRNIPTDKLNHFFVNCGMKLGELCKTYEDKAPADTSTKGMNACLTKARLQEARKAILSTTKIKEFYESELADVDTGIAVEVNRYRKNESEENNLDNLTNFTANDFLESRNKERIDIAKGCKEDPSKEECKNLYAVGDDLDRAIHQIEMESEFSWEAEKARIDKLEGDGLKKYLEEKGYFNLLERLNAEGLTKENIAQEIKLVFDAKRAAVIATVNARVGRRQLREAEAADVEEMNIRITESANVTIDENARLAQAILFNNIITSYLTLKRQDGSDIGRNVNPLMKEQRNLPADVEGEFFEQLKDTTPASSSASYGDQNINGLSILDTFLGKPSSPN